VANYIAPTVTVTTPTIDRTPTWSWNALLGASVYRYSFNQSTWFNTSLTTFTPLSDLDIGSNTLYVKGGNGSTWGSIGSAEVVITESIDSFAYNFPIIYSEMQKQEISGVYPRIYISNVDLNENNNLDSTLVLALSDGSNTVNISGDYTYFEGLVVINDEILYLSSPTLFSNYTIFSCERAKNFTKAFNHLEGTRIRSIQELEVVNYNYSHKANTTSTSIFAPVLSSGELVFLDNVKKWLITSNSKEYDLAKNRPIYIFEGANKQSKCMFQGYVYDWDTNAKAGEVTLMFKDELTLLNNKSIKFTKTYINQFTLDVIQDLLGVDYVIPLNDTNIAHYGKLDRITTMDYDTYGAMLSYICESKCMRLSYDEYGFVRVYSDLFKTIDTYSTDLEVKDSIDLIDINETTENTLVLNKFTSNFKNRYPYYDKNQFLDGTTLRYINFRYSLLNKALVLMTSEGFINFDIVIGENIKFLNIGDYILIKDNINDLEFRCKLFEVNGTTGSFIGGFDRDRAWNPRGKNSYLIGLGYTSSRNFDVFYSEINLQTVFALNVESDGSDKSSNLKIPLLAGEELEYNCTFGSFETNDVKFSGIVEDIEGIYGTLTGGTDLLYMRDYEQSETGSPAYLLSNKLIIQGTGNEQLYYYTTFDNSNIEVEVSDARDNESNINLKIRNTLTSQITYNITPFETIGKILRVNSYSYSNYLYTGNVIKLHSDNALDDRTEPYYSVRSDVKWTVESKFSEGGLYYIVLDKSFPIGDDNIQMKFISYKYDKVIHLNEFRIMGNPIVEEEQSLVKLNADSISKYDEIEFNFDGKLTNLEDLKYSISYLYNNYAGLPNNYTRIIPFEAFFRPDIDLLSIVKLYDSNITDMNAEEVIIIEKSVSVDGNGGREENYLGITKSDNLSDLTTLNVDSSKNFYTTLYPTEYNHTGNEGLDSEIDGGVDNLYVSKMSTVGNISILKVPIEDYWGVSQTTIRTDETNLTLSLFGDKSIYNVSVFKNGNKSVILMGTEYILVKSLTSVTATSTSVNLEIVERDIFGTGRVEITNGQIAQICQITQFTDQDGMIIDGVITVGSKNGKIEFLESGLVLNDYQLFSGLTSNRGFSLIDESRGNKGDLFSVRISESTTDVLWNTLRIENTSFSISLQENEQSNIFMQGLWAGSGVGKKTITVKGLLLSSEKLSISDYINTNKSGILSYHDSHFYGYNGSSWVRLDNESITPYPGYADEVILPNNGTSFSTTTGRLQWAFDNLYFNLSSSQTVSCLTQYIKTYSSNITLDPYVGSHLINVTSSAVTITIPYSPGNYQVLGKTYEIIHMDGDVVSNNITISGAGNTFYEMGSDTSLGSTLTINTTGGYVKLYPTATKWYVVQA